MEILKKKKKTTNDITKMESEFIALHKCAEGVKSLCQQYADTVMANLRLEIGEFGHLWHMVCYFGLGGY